MYMPPNTMGYSQGHFKCMHSTCAGRTKVDFFGALHLAMATPANTPNMHVAKFYYVCPTNQFLYVPTMDQWSTQSVDTFIAYEHWPIDEAAESVPPSRWLMLHRRITQEAWPRSGSTSFDTLLSSCKTRVSRSITC
jgi:hypothetical protein